MPSLTKLRDCFWLDHSMSFWLYGHGLIQGKLSSCLLVICQQPLCISSVKLNLFVFCKLFSSSFFTRIWEHVFTLVFCIQNTTLCYSRPSITMWLYIRNLCKSIVVVNLTYICILVSMLCLVIFIIKTYLIMMTSSHNQCDKNHSIWKQMLPQDFESPLGGKV